MANQQHLALLKQGVEIWNQWRENNDQIIVDLSGADLSRANLNEANLKIANLNQADLRMANLSDANLTGADLTGADLRGVNLRGATLNLADLNQADLSGAHLMLANIIEANLIGVNLSEANLKIANLTRANLSEANLKMANLSGTNLTETNFSMANLTDANLRMANLTDANLERTQVLDTNFNKAILTGTCLQNWQTNSATDLKDVICEYVYLQVGQQERRPLEGNFATGEFVKLWRSLNTSNLIVNDQAPAVQDYQIEHYTSFLPAPEVAAKIEVLPQPNQYQTPPASEPEVAAKIEPSPQPVKYYNPPVSKPAVVVERQDLPYSQPQTLFNHTSPSNLPKEVMEVEQLIKQIDKHISQSKWSELAAEIQELLQQLTQACPINTPLEKVIVVAAAIKQLESQTALKSKVLNALQAGADQDLKTLVNHPLIHILMPALAGWE